MIIRDREEGDVLGGKTMEGANGVIREETVSGRVRQLSIGLIQVIIPVRNHSSTAFVSQKDKDVGTGPEGVKGLVYRLGQVRRNLVKLGWKIVEKMWEISNSRMWEEGS